MGNGIQKTFLDNNAAARQTEKENKCRSEAKETLKFENLHSHSIQVFPQQFAGFGATIKHLLGKHANFSHTATIDVISETKEKEYLLDVQWNGCKECHSPTVRDDIAKHINRLLVSLSLNPIEYIPNSHTLKLKNVALHYLTENFTAGIWTKNLFIGDKRILASFSDSLEIAKNCNHFGAEFTFSVTPSVIVGIRGSHSGFDNGYARINQSDYISVAARVALSSNSTVLSTQVGQGNIDLHISTNLAPQLQVAVAIHSSLRSIAKNSVKYGLKLSLPDESAIICVAVDNRWKVEASIKKQIKSTPLLLMATTAFNPATENAHSHKFGVGFEYAF